MAAKITQKYRMSVQRGANLFMIRLMASLKTFDNFRFQISDFIFELKQKWSQLFEQQPPSN